MPAFLLAAVFTLAGDWDVKVDGTVLHVAPPAITTVKAEKYTALPIFNPQKHHWTAEDDKLLRERPSTQVALLLRVSPMAVRHRRSRLGILRPGALETSRPSPWQPEEDARLGTSWDAEVARQLGRSVFCVKSRRERLGIPSVLHRWTPQADALLGPMPDQQVARRLGITLKAVARRRERLGIPVGGRKFKTPGTTPRPTPSDQ